ncbi:MAG TPA: peptide ABC transporter substrate-binding protein [Stellaceae bacterium]|nr:peptide ABC transporter substrate-binding protein [Stellaceae bacterium]
MTRRAIILLFGFLLSTAISAAAAPSRPPDELSIGVTQFPSTLNPIIDEMFVKDYVLGAVRRPLVSYDPDWKLVCMLCTELPSFDNGRARQVDLGDGKTGVAVTYTLLPDARWGDGAPVTTEDVAFSYEVGKSPLVPVADAETYRRIVKLDIKDAKTFTLTLDRLTFDYASAAAFDILPAHLERAAFADPAQYRFRTLYDSDPTNPGLYDGPYRIAAIAPGSHIVLERNPYWSGQKPYFRLVVIWTVENTAAVEANLLAGGLDMVAGELGLSLDEALAFEKHHGSAFNILYKPGLSYEHIDLNLDNPILADRRVRQALLYGIDRKAISDGIFAGRDPVADSFLPPLDPAYSADVPHYAYDPAKARALLDDAGWHLASDGIRRKDGAPLALELATTSGNRTREMIEQVLQAQWRQIGIDVRLKNQPARVLIAETTAHRNFQMAMFAWVAAPESVPRSELYSNEVPSAENSWSGENYVGFRNPEADRLIDAIEVELGRTKRLDLWRQLQVLYAEQLPALPLYFRADAYVLPKWLAGVTPTGHDAPSTLWIENWRRVVEPSLRPSRRGPPDRSSG